MALADEVTNRYSDQELIELTNPESATATTIDTTYLGRAVTDVQAAFKVHAQIEYDGTVDTHVLTAVDGVIARLRTWARTGGVGNDANSAWQDWVDNQCKPLKSVTSRARVSPVTTSQLTPSAEVADGETRRPVFDEARLRRFTPGSRSDDPYFDND